MPRVKLVKAARKEHHCSYCGNPIYIGSGYYWWKHKLQRGGLVKKRCKGCGYPKRYMLTLSPFFSALWQAEDAFQPSTPDELEGAVAEFVEELESLIEEAQESLDNMPGQLQDSSESGQLLQERIEALEGWVASLGDLDTEVPEEIRSLYQGQEDDIPEAAMEWLEERIEAAMVENTF